jgi:hypothetical protein
MASKLLHVCLVAAMIVACSAFADRKLQQVCDRDQLSELLASCLCV